MEVSRYGCGTKGTLGNSLGATVVGDTLKSEYPCLALHYPAPRPNHYSLSINPLPPPGNHLVTTFTLGEGCIAMETEKKSLFHALTIRRGLHIIYMYMGKSFRTLLLSLVLLAGVFGTSYAQDVAVKTNFAHWAALGSPNLSLEVALGRKVTADLYGGMNLWKLPEPKNFRHWMVQPELRYWFCDVFNGHFIGLHGHGGQYNIGGLDIPVGRLTVFKDHRYQGYFYGAGLSYGYQWILGKHWNLEASIGGGYARIWYEKFPCATCGTKLGEGYYDYWGVTRATLSLVYIF